MTASNDTTLVGEPVEYRIGLANFGDLAAENVRLKMVANPGLRMEFAPPFIPSQQTNVGAEWDIGILQARQSFETSIRITPTAESDNRIQFVATASGAPPISETANLALLAVKPQIDLTFAPVAGSEQVEVGQASVFQVVVRNTGRSTLNGLNLLIDTDPGLQHAEAGSNQISRQIPYLPAGQAQELTVRFIVRKAGELKAKLVAQANGLPIAERTAFVRGIDAVPRPSSMSIELRTPNGTTQLAPNAETSVQAVVQNRGQTMLTNIQVIADYESSLGFVQASQGIQHLAAARQLTWTIPALEPGKQYATELFFRALAPSPSPAIRVTARSGEGINAQQVLPFSISGNSGGQAPILPSTPPVMPSTPPNREVMPTPGTGAAPPASTAPSNTWSLLIQPVESQVAAGNRARYSVSFQNPRSQADQDVVVQFQVPAGVQVISCVAVDGAPIRNQRSDDGRNLQLEPLRTLRPNEAVGLILELQHDVPGLQVLEVILTSAAEPQSIRQQARINVLPNLR